jgi:hypothetical protein
MVFIVRFQAVRIAGRRRTGYGYAGSRQILPGKTARTGAIYRALFTPRLVHAKSSSQVFKPSLQAKSSRQVFTPSLHAKSGMF